MGVGVRSSAVKMAIFGQFSSVSKKRQKNDFFRIFFCFISSYNQSLLSFELFLVTFEVRRGNKPREGAAARRATRNRRRASEEPLIQQRKVAKWSDRRERNVAECSVADGGVAEGAREEF